MLIGRTALGTVASLALLAVLPVLLGMTTTVVMSDSMAPGLRAGDAVVVRSVPASAVRIGQVVLADDPDFPGRLRLHRMVGRRDGDLVLRGDANAQADAATITPRAVRGVGFLRVPWVGLPVLWLRTGQPALAVATGLALALVAAAVALLDRDAAVGPYRAAARRLLHRLPLGRATAVLLVGAGAGAVATGAAGAQSSWSVFQGITTSPGDSVATGTFDCPSRAGIPTPGFYYSFMPASGATEPNLGNAGAGYTATVTPASMRVSGTCRSGSSPYLQFTGSGSEAVVGTTSVTATGNGTQSVWFSPSATTGVLDGIGGSAGTTASQSDRQLYFTSAGLLAFAMRDGTGIASCQISTAPALGTWHLAVVTYDNTAKRFTLYLDGSGTSCTGTITTPATLSGYVRLGRDAPIASNASTGSYAGGIDEAAAWGSVLTPANVTAIYSTGH